MKMNISIVRRFFIEVIHWAVSLSEVDLNHTKVFSSFSTESVRGLFDEKANEIRLGL